MLRFARQMRMSFWGGGELHAVGTAETPIRLLGAEAERGYWIGLSFSSTSATGDEQQVLEHVELAHAGAPQPSVDPSAIRFSSHEIDLQLRHVLLRDNAGFALRRGTGTIGTTVLVVDDVRFARNEAPIALTPDLLHAVDPNVTFDGNDANLIQLGSPSTVVMEARQDLTFAAYDVPIVLEQSLAMIGATLTIAPGATVQVAPNRQVSTREEGRLLLGGAGSRTTVTRKPDAAHWVGFYLGEARPGHVIDNALIAYGGSADTSGAGSTVLGCSNVTYANNALEDLVTVGVADGANIAAGCIP